MREHIGLILSNLIDLHAELFDTFSPTQLLDGQVFHLACSVSTQHSVTSSYIYTLGQHKLVLRYLVYEIVDGNHFTEALHGGVSLCF